MDIDAVIEAINIEQDTMNSLHAKLWAMRDERDALLGTVARLRELLTKDVLENASGLCERQSRLGFHPDGLGATVGMQVRWAGRAEALSAAAALLWPGEG
jgi:hypothetical protein